MFILFLICSLNCHMYTAFLMLFPFQQQPMRVLRQKLLFLSGKSQVLVHTFDMFLYSYVPQNEMKIINITKILPGLEWPYTCADWCTVSSLDRLALPHPWHVSLHNLLLTLHCLHTNNKNIKEENLSRFWNTTALFVTIMKFLLFNPILTGGGGGVNLTPPAQNPRLPRDRRRSRHVFSWLFSFKSCASFDTKFAKIGPSVARSRDVLYSHVGTNLPKICILHRFVYKTHGLVFQ